MKKVHFLRLNAIVLLLITGGSAIFARGWCLLSPDGSRLGMFGIGIALFLAGMVLHGEKSLRINFANLIFVMVIRRGPH